MRGDVVQFYWFVGLWVGGLRRKIEIKQRSARVLGSGGDSRLLTLLEGDAGRDGVGQQFHVTDDFIRGKRWAENNPGHLRAKCDKKRSLSRRNIALPTAANLQAHAREDGCKQQRAAGQQQHSDSVE